MLSEHPAEPVPASPPRTSTFLFKLKISHSSFQSSIICPKSSTSHILQSGGLSYQRCKKIAFPLCFIVSYKQAITSFPSYSLTKKAALNFSSGYLPNERRYIAATFISFLPFKSNSFSNSVFLYPPSPAPSPDHYLCCLILIPSALFYLFSENNKHIHLAPSTRTAAQLFTVPHPVAWAQAINCKE